MTIQDVIKSGKPFRRKAWPPEDVWAIAAPGDEVFSYAHPELNEEDQDNDGIFPVTIDDILADDWETRQ